VSVQFDDILNVNNLNNSHSVTVDTIIDTTENRSKDKYCVVATDLQNKGYVLVRDLYDTTDTWNSTKIDTPIDSVILSKSRSMPVSMPSNQNPSFGGSDANRMYT